MADKNKTLVAILVAIIVVMAIVLLYIFLIQPSITGYAVERQQEGVDFALASIIEVVAQCQPFPVSVGEDQTITLYALECLQAPDQAQQ